MAPALDRLGGEVVRLRSRDGVRLAGRWLGAEPDDGWAADPREAILLLHGWSGSVTPNLLDVGPFLRRTAGVLGLDFRGHGGSDDAPTSFGLNEVEDVAGALAWLGERGIRRVALVGSSMGGITAIAAVAVLGDGRLASADADAAAPAATVDAPRPRIVAVVADSVTPELALVVANRLRLPFGRRIANHAFTRMARRLGGDPRETQPIAVIGLLEDLPLLLVHGAEDQTVTLADARRLAAAAPAGQPTPRHRGGRSRRRTRGGPGRVRDGRECPAPCRVRCHPTIADRARHARILHTHPAGSPAHIREETGRP